MDVEKRGRKYYLTVSYEDKTHQIPSDSLIYGHLGKFIGVRTSEFRFSSGQRICDNKRDITILDVYRGTLECSPHMHKMLTYKCNRCGHVKARVRECDVMRGTGCPVCNGKIVKSGFNDIPSNEPWMIPYFPKGIEQARLYTPSSSRQLRLVCPYCGRLSDHSMAIATLYRTHSIGCPCGDGISFPEKFVFYFFQTINVVEYTRQVSSKDFTWCGRYRYDGMFRIDGQVYFLEVHGLQHFEHTGYERISASDLETTKENDRRKKALAIEHGIPEENYIVLDCRKSTLNHLKAAILSSPLADILKIRSLNIAWEDIFIKALAPLQKNILDYALKHPCASTKDIAKQFGVHPSYPARILNASGMYGKNERAKRKSKTFYEENRLRLFKEIEKLLSYDPDMTIAEISCELGRTKSGIYALLRKYEHDIDLETLGKNAERVRVERAKATVCKSVKVSAPDHSCYEFGSLTAACSELEQKYQVRLPMSSVSVSISRKRPFRGFVFQYIDL